LKIIIIKNNQTWIIKNKQNELLDVQKSTPAATADQKKQFRISGKWLIKYDDLEIEELVNEGSAGAVSLLLKKKKT